MASLYCTREQVKRAGNINGSSFDSRIDRIIEGVSRDFDKATRRFFIPKTETRTYRWPPHQPSRSYILWLDQGLISVTTLQAKAQDSSPTTISSSDFFLEPANTGPPYNRIEIDLSSTSAFEAGDTSQRSISVAGLWGYGNDTRSAGTVASGLDSSASATSFVCSDGSLIDAGHSLLIESEQIFVTERTNAQVATETITSDVAANAATVTIPVDTGSNFNVGEVILINSERMLIESISSNDLTVIRAYDGSTLAAHSSADEVHAFRTLTIERGVNGTTAATHADSTAISVYEPPFDVVSYCVADSLARFAQESAQWGRQVGTGEGAVEFNGRNLDLMRRRTVNFYKMTRSAVI